MKHGRYEELRLGLAAGNSFKIVPAGWKDGIEITGLKKVNGQVFVRLHKNTLPGRVTYRWHQIGPGDEVRCRGEFAPVYTAKDLGVVAVRPEVA